MKLSENGIFLDFTRSTPKTKSFILCFVYPKEVSGTQSQQRRYLRVDRFYFRQVYWFTFQKLPQQRSNSRTWVTTSPSSFLVVPTQSLKSVCTPWKLLKTSYVSIFSLSFWYKKAYCFSTVIDHCIKNGTPKEGLADLQVCRKDAENAPYLDDWFVRSFQPLVDGRERAGSSSLQDHFAAIQAVTLVVAQLVPATELPNLLLRVWSFHSFF